MLKQCNLQLNKTKYASAKKSNHVHVYMEITV